MKFVVLSDMHGDLAYIDQLDEVISSSDGIIFGGDFTRFNEPETGLPALKKIVKNFKIVLTIIQVNYIINLVL